MVIYIKDYNDSRLDAYARLTEAQLRNRLEPEKGIFIAESPKVIRLALNAGYVPLSMLTTQKHIDGDAADIVSSLPTNVPVFTSDDTTLEKITGFHLTRGVMCAMRRKPLPELNDILKGAHRVAVLENIVDYTNIGAIIRSAAALNVDGVLVTPTCSDPLYRRSVRVSMGTVFQIPWTIIGDSHTAWPEKGLAVLREFGFRTVAMALDENSVSIDNKDICTEQRLAIILGAEGDGLAKKTIAGCDYTVKIPMAHGVDSLNVAAASAVAFWQLRYQL